MICESWPWREELLHVAERLAARCTQQRWTERSAFLLERDIMVSAYAIRKLCEALKLSTAFNTQDVPLTEYSLRGSAPDQQNWHNLDRFYDFENAHEVTVKPMELCNQIIHSRVFMRCTVADGHGLDGIFVSSDRASRKCLYFVKVDTLVGLFRQAGEEDVISLSMVRDKKGDWEVTEALAAPRV